MSSSISKHQAKVLLLSSLGGMLDFYDFVIFAVFAIPIGKSFFPNDNPLLEMMAAFAAFAIGYLARPLGGIVFSHYGDKYGRKKSFIVSIVIMGLATLAMGLMPTYQQFGLAMPVLFLMLRFIQGLAVGGEIPGAITYVTEHIKHRPGLAGGIIFLFLNLGIMAAHLFNGLINAISPILPFAVTPWRVAFVLGGGLAIISYFLRTSLDESPEFLNFDRETHRFPLIDLLKNQKQHLIVASFIVAIQATLISLIYLYSVSFMQLNASYSEYEITHFSLYVLGVFCLANAFWGHIGDKWGHKKILRLGALLLIPSSYTFYQSLAAHAHLYFQASLMGVISGMTTGCFSAVIAKMFPTSVRYSGIALSYNLAFAVFAGLTPLLATSLINQTHNLLMPAYLAMFMSVLGFIALFFCQDSQLG